MPTSGITKILWGRVLSHPIFSDRALLVILLAVAFLFPIFFVPSQLVAPEFAKMILFEVLILVAAFSWAAGRLHDGHIGIPKSLLLVISFLLVVEFVVAAFVSPAPLLSFIGSGYDLGTVNSFVLLFLLMFFSAIVFFNRDRVLMLYAAFLLSGILVMCYHLARQFFGPDFLDFGLFTSAVATPVGRWNDLAALIGGVLLLVLSTRYFFPENKLFRIPSYVIFIVGLFFLLSINFTVLWLVLIVMMGVLIALAIYEGEREHKKKFHEAKDTGVGHVQRPFRERMLGHLPGMATILLLVAVLYGGGLANVSWGKNSATIATVVGRALHATPYSEVVLTPQFTFDIIKSELKESPLFGTSPNRFSSAYLKYKISVVNSTPFWDATFDFGLGRIPTYFGTTGLLGTTLWLLFVIFLFVQGRKVFRLFAKDRVAAYLGFSLFLLTIYFWSLAFFYLPNITIFAFAFLFAGALIAFLTGEGVLATYRIQFGGGSRLSVFLTPIIIALLVGVISALVLLHRQVSSLVLFGEAQIAAGANHMDDAQKDLMRANNFAERDVYLRALSNLSLVKLRDLAKQKLPPEGGAQEARRLVDDARTNAERAIKLDPTNFENHLQYAAVFDTLASFGVPNMFQFSRNSYEQALRLNPKSPRVLFMLARTLWVGGDRAGAKDYLRQALMERPNFPEALSLFVQLEMGDKNPDSAIAALRLGVAAEPTNFLLHFALGYLYYLQSDQQAALAEFESAVALNPAYADAKYFLGLSYARLGRRDDAIQQFVGVQTLNPENKEVAAIIENIKTGKEPFAGSVAAPTTPGGQIFPTSLKGKGKNK